MDNEQTQQQYRDEMRELKLRDPAMYASEMSRIREERNKFLARPRSPAEMEDLAFLTSYLSKPSTQAMLKAHGRKQRITSMEPWDNYTHEAALAGAKCLANFSTELRDRLSGLGNALSHDDTEYFLRQIIGMAESMRVTVAAGKGQGTA